MAAPRSLTYGQVMWAVEALAPRFAALGLGCGSRAVIASRDDIATAQLFLAMLRLGITAVVVDPTAPAMTLRKLIVAADPAAVALDQALLDALVADGGDALPAPTMVIPAGGDVFGAQRSGYPDGQGPPAIPCSTGAYILFTSGTTSEPKGVEISHRTAYRTMRTMGEHLGYDATTRELNTLVFHHADGLEEGLLLAFCFGASIHRPAPFSLGTLPDLLGAIRRDRLTHAHLVPTMLAMIQRLGPEVDDCFTGPEFRFVLSTGGPLEEGLWRSFEARFRTMVVNAYGMTEAANELLFCGPDAATRKVGTNGKPVGCRARIIKEDGHPAGRGEVGELLFQTDNLMTGYFRRPEATAAVLIDGWLHSGDLASADADGFISIVGRKKHTIITSGINIYPEDIDRVLMAIAGVREAATVGVPDPIWGERVVACVVLEGPGGPSVDQILAACRAALPAVSVPKSVYLVDDLPRGHGGKIQVLAVRAMIAGLESAPTSGFNDEQHVELYRLAARSLGVHFRSLKSTLPLSSAGPAARTTLVRDACAYFEVDLPGELGARLETLGDLEVALAARLQGRMN